MKILIYDDNDLMYYNILANRLTYANDDVALDTNSISDVYKYYTQLPHLYNELHLSMYDMSKSQSIELDPTTMQRIAKYNKEAEIAKLDEEIKAKEEKIKELDEFLQDKDKRAQKIKDYVAKIYEIDLDSYEDDDDEDEEW